jgi:Na+-driven multidrug efflux pump
MLRALLSLLAALVALVPGAVLAWVFGEPFMRLLCPSADGPNLCMLGGTILLMAVVPLILSAIAAVIVWKTMSTKEEQA